MNSNRMGKKTLWPYQKLFLQLVKFGIVGVTSASVNYIVVIALVEITRLTPLVANIFGYLIGFLVSFSGHKYWTFSSHSTSASSLPKFLVVSAAGFLANENLFYLFLNYLYLDYKIALLLVLLIVPPFTFLFSKLWAFRHQQIDTANTAETT